MTANFPLTTIPAFPQDLFYTNKGQNNNNSLVSDSNLVENLSNGTRLLFESFPEQDDYKFNLSTGEQEGPSGILEYRSIGK